MTQQIPNISFNEGIPDVDAVGFDNLLVMDDLMGEATNDKDVCDIFTLGSHHRKMSVICLLQNLYNKGKENRTINLNTQYLILQKNPRDLQQISHLARQMYPHNTSHFMDKFRKATSIPYGCLVVDLKQDTPDSERLKSGNVFSTQPVTTTTPTTATSVAMMAPTTAPSTAAMMLPTTTPSTHAQPMLQIEAEPSAEDQMGGGQQAEYFGPPGILANPDAEAELYIQTDSPSRLPEQTGRGEDEMNTAATCRSCGIQFQTPHFLARHRVKGCDMQEDEDEDEDEQHAWKDLVNQAYKKHDKQYGEKAAALEEEGVDEKDIEIQVTETLMPLYRKSLVNIYKQFVAQSHDLDKNPYHRDIMQTLRWYIEWKGYKFDRALDITMRKKRHLFEEILDAEQELLNKSEKEQEEEEEDTETEAEEDEEEEEEEEEEEAM
jgi:hypothetical protein